MNFSLTSFLVVSVVAFTLSFASMQQSAKKNSRPIQTTETKTSEARRGERESGNGPGYNFWHALDPERAKIREQILEGWPTTDRHFYMSRGGPRLDHYAEFVMDETGTDLNSYCLGNLIRVTNGKRESFALTFDCNSRTAKIFANNKWQDYRSWKTANLKDLSAKQKGA
jgi:hypothetical protein